MRAKTDAGTPEQRLADALAQLAAHGPGGQHAKTRRGPRPVVRIVVDHNGDATVDGAPVPPETVADVLADDDTRVQTVTRQRRRRHRHHLASPATSPKPSATPSKRRDPTCVVPGCGSRLGLQIDHVHDFAHNGPTSLDNLCRLCRHHHRLKTIGRYTISRNPDGTWNYRPRR